VIYDPCPPPAAVKAIAPTATVTYIDGTYPTAAASLAATSSVAIANLLFGKVNPSGKLPITFPAQVSDLPRPVIPTPSGTTGFFDVDYTIDGLNVGYKWYQSQNLKPLFASRYARICRLRGLDASRYSCV